jgi:hypothetical protein
MIEIADQIKLPIRFRALIVLLTHEMFRGLMTVILNKVVADPADLSALLQKPGRDDITIYLDLNHLYVHQHRF